MRLAPLFEDIFLLSLIPLLTLFFSHLNSSVGIVILDLHFLQVIAIGILGLGLWLCYFLYSIPSTIEACKERLVPIFRQSYSMILLSLCILILGNGVLILGAVSLIPILWPIAFMTAILSLGAIALGLWRVLLAFYHFRTGPVLTEVAQQLHWHDAPQLWSHVHDIARQIAVAPPDYILTSIGEAFYVTETPVRCINGRLQGRILVLSLPQCRILTVEEVKAIIAHELAHFKGKDTELTRRFDPIYTSALTTLARLDAEQTYEGWRYILLFPVQVIMQSFLDIFEVAECAERRERELMADAVSAQVIGPQVLATALVKMAIFASVWENTDHSIHYYASCGQQLRNISDWFATSAQYHAKRQDALDGLDQHYSAHPIDSHPSLSERLAALQVSFAQVRQAALAIFHQETAIHLMHDPEPLEERLSAIVGVMYTTTASFQQAVRLVRAR